MPKFDFSEEARQTNARYASEIATLTSLRVADIQRLFPTRADKEELEQLLRIVHGSASRNKKVARLGEQFSQVGSAAIKLLEFLA